MTIVLGTALRDWSAASARRRVTALLPGTISTIEGNTGNGKVEERVRPKSQVVGYGYPEYAV
ncbi:hypothetical protein [Nonomuraea basaltis]|uniref:hypothetical protein n=1 Tax=Nonomuraea basaltis TaxID=2495887 RepID=UPI001F1105D3|nr:hypothetical protein [Nonomuraea basaltis]